MNNLAFHILHVEQRSPNEWYVGGRALTDICIGDMLEIRRPYIPSMGDEGTFVVTAITAYNVSMPKLSHGVTGMLTLHYDQGALLNKDMKLVHITTGSPPNPAQYRSSLDPKVTIRVEGDLREDVLAFKQSLEAHDEDLLFQPIATVRDRFVLHGAVFPRATPSNVEHFRYVLRRFNETVDTLLSLSFVQHLVKRGNDTTIQEDHTDNAHDLFNATAPGLGSEATAAFVLTMRCFIDDTEECSLENLAHHYTSATIGTEHAYLYLANRDLFAIALNGVTELVDRYPVVDTDGNVIGRIDKPLTQRQVFDLCLYGGFSHAKRTKTQQFDALVSDPVTRAMLWQRFVHILGEYCDLLTAQSYVNKAMLLELEMPM